MAEHEGGTRVPLETQVREQFSAEWKKADTPDKKKSLLQRLLEMIKDVSVSAKTAVNEAEKANSGAIPPNAKDAKESAAKPILEFLQFLSGNNGQPLDPEALKTLQLSETQVSFLQSLAKTRHDSNSATFLSQIIEKATNKDNPQYLTVSKPGETTRTPLEIDIEATKLNENATNSLKDSLKRLSQEGKLKDTKGNVLTEADVEQKFQSSNRAESQQQSRTPETQNQQTEDVEEQFQHGPQSERQTRSRARRNRRQVDAEQLRQYSILMDKFKAANKPQADDFEARMMKINSDRSGIEADSNLTAEVKSQRIKALTDQSNEIESQYAAFNAEESAAFNYLISDEIGPPFTESENPADAVRSYLRQRFNVSDNELNNIQHIYKEGTGTLDGTYEGYQDLANTINVKYTAELMEQSIIKNGKLDIEAVKRLQAQIEDDIGVLFESLYNSPKASFQDAFSSYSEGQMLRKIVQHLRVEFIDITNSLEGSDKRKAIKDILTDMIISPIQRRPSLEQIVHQYQQVGATIDLEKLKDILKTYNITTLQEFYNDDLTKIISDLMPTFVQKKFVENGNEMVTDLFQLAQVEKDFKDDFVKSDPKDRSKKFVVKYRDECIEYMFDVIKAMNEKKGLPEVSRERINARFSRAYLDNFLLSLRGIKVMSSALPMHHKFGDVPFVNLITGVFNPQQGWGKFGLRGRGHQENGDAETTEFQGMNNFAFNEIAAKEWIKKYGDVFDDFHPAKMKKEGDKRVLFEVFPDNHHLMEDLRSGRWDAFNNMLDVYKGMVFGNIIDQSGWTFDGFNDTTINNLSQDFMEGRKFGDLTRKEKMELKYKTSGVITAFWDVDGYAAEDVMNRFVRFLYTKESQIAINSAIQSEAARKGRSLTDEEQTQIAKDAIGNLQKGMKSDMDWIKTTGEYTKGDKRFDKIFDVKLGGKDQKVAFREYRMHRVNAIKGEIFHQLLLKDPNAWLGEMVQSYPQLGQGYVSYKDKNGTEKHVLGSEFYFNMNEIPDSSISKDDKVKRDRFRFEVLTKFRGKEEDDYMTNVPHLQKIMNFYAKIMRNEAGIQSGQTIDKDQMQLINEHKGKALSKLSVNLAIAHQLAVDGSQPTINKDNINDPDIKDAMYGTDGLVTYFNDMVKKPNYFGDGETDLGEENGFYQRWSFSKEQSGTRFLPEGDTNMKYLFEDVRNTQALDRRLNTDMAFAKAQEVLGNVPSVCKKAADADNFGSWYSAIEELHHDMAVIADEDQAMEQKYQQILYQTICNWFSLDSDTEKMFTGWVYQMGLGANAAMATLKSDNMTKFLLDQDSRREYLNKLRDKSYLKGNYDMIGGWGFDTAEMIAGVNIKEIILKQLAYAAAGAIAVTIITAIKEGYEEEVEED